MMSEISSVGRPTEVSTITMVTSPACGIPAAPMLAAVAVILGRLKKREFLNVWSFSPLLYITIVTFCFDCLYVANTFSLWLGNMNYYELSIKSRENYYYTNKHWMIQWFIQIIGLLFKNVLFLYFLFSTVKKSTAKYREERTAYNTIRKNGN